MSKLIANSLLKKGLHYRSGLGHLSPQKAEKGNFMKTFYIAVTETLNRIVEVHAEDDYEAIHKVSDAYYDGQIVLDSEDYVDVQFNDETEETIYNYELGGMPKFYEVQ